MPETPPIPERSAFGARFAPDAPRGRPIARLHKLLSTIPAESESDVRLDWLQKLARWALDDEAGHEGERLRTLSAVLQAHPRVGTAVAGQLHRVLDQGQAARLFASTGLPSKAGLLAEATKRLVGHLLPEPPVAGNLEQILTHLFPSPLHATRLATLPAAAVEELLTLLQSPLAPLRAGLPEAALLLSARIGALGLSDDFLERLPPAPASRSPFVELSATCGALAQSTDATDACHRLGEVIARCREVTRQVHAHLEAGNVSIDLVYRLKLIDLELDRLALVARALDARGADAVEAGLSLTSALVAGAARERSLRALAGQNVQLLSKKIVEHSGATGDHYITSDRREYLKMLASAGGGGVLTAGTTVAKFWVGAAKLPLLLEGVFSAVNYAGSFVVMQLAGFTLATKQPSMTGAALARALGRREEEGNLSAWTEVVARITRSQLAAALGNLGMVVPAVLLIELYRRLQGQAPLLDEPTAHYAIDSLHPLASLTIPFAALTGVLLWLSSVFAGATHNWAHYRRLPEALASVRWVKRLLGSKGSARLQHFLSHSAAGFGGNVSLGVLLALTPLVGKLTGLPLDVRHVTLSTGALTFGASALGLEGIDPWAMAAALGGIGLVALLNFGVSFALALWVALRAEGVSFATRGDMLGALWAKARSAPLDFIRPPPVPKSPPVEPTPETT